MSGGARSTVCVIILTLNEEINLPCTIESVIGWADEVLVLDSGSSDATTSIARDAGCLVHDHAFVDYGSQRNYALTALPIESEWVLFLDADERVTPELRLEISHLIAATPMENGFLVRRRLMWMGRWIRRAYYPVWILRLFRRSAGRCEERVVNEHVVVDGAIGRLQHDLIHEDRKPLSSWIAKHARYAELEATEALRRSRGHKGDDGGLQGTQAGRTRWLREHVWERLPLLVRPFLYFGYRYLLRGGFLDGRAGFTFHFLHALWYPMLIDIDCLTLRRGVADPASSLSAPAAERASEARA